MATRRSLRLRAKEGSDLLEPQGGHRDPNEWNRQCQLFHQVFGIELLREKILNYAIHEGGKVSGTNAGTCRLVERSWLEAVHKCLTKDGTPLLQFRLWKFYDEWPESVLNQFLDTYASSSPKFNIIPPFEVRIDFSDEVALRSSKRVLEKCLRWCTRALVSLDLSFCCSYFQFIIPESVSFPVLRKLVIWIWALGGNTEEQQHLFCREIAAGTQSILTKCKNLTHLRLKDDIEYGSSSCGRVSTSFKTLSLPATITKLELESGMFNADMEELIRNNALPKLTVLHLDVPQYIPDDSRDMIYRISAPVRSTLKKLKIGGYGKEDSEMTPIRLPILKNLESLSIFMWYWKWGDGVDLGSSLPVVRKMKIRHLTSTNLLRLVLNNQFGSTANLDINFSHKEFTDLTLSAVQFPRAFPNISVLKITSEVANDAPHTFQTIFENLSQLRELHLHIEEMYDFPVASPPQFWNLMFLGRLPEEITEVNPPSVTKMTGLSVLDLYFARNGFREGNSGKLPDDVFEFGFLRMPQLLKLTLGGSMMASTAIARKWELAGRNLEVTHDNLYD